MPGEPLDFRSIGQCDHDGAVPEPALLQTLGYEPRRGYNIVTQLLPATVASIDPDGVWEVCLTCWYMDKPRGRLATGSSFC